MKKHFVYMIEERGSVTDLSVKIGVSRQIDQRISEMQVGNPRILRVAIKFGPFSHDQAYEMEAKMHKCFNKFHVRGEWFDVCILDRMEMLRVYEDQQRIDRAKNKASFRERKAEKAFTMEFNKRIRWMN